MRSRAIGYYRRTKDYVDQCVRLGVADAAYHALHLDASHSEPFVAVIPNGRVWGKDGCVLTPNHRILWDVSREWSPNPIEHSIFRQSELPPLTVTEEVVAVLNKVGSQNYFHWMFDILPRIHLLRLGKMVANRYLVGEQLASFQVETLGILGIRPEQTIMAHETLHLQAKQLMVPALPEEEKWVFDFLRSTFLPVALSSTPTEQPPSRHIYISREKCVGRRTVNESDVRRGLEAYGFQTIYPEDLSVAEQVRIFAEADIIVGAQGAGLANIAFCRPGTTVIELMSPSFFITLTEQLCRQVELNYVRVMAQSEHNTTCTAEPYWSGWDNIVVDVGQLIDIIEQVGASRA